MALTIQIIPAYQGQFVPATIHVPFSKDVVEDIIHAGNKNAIEYIQADGDEIEFLISRFKNLPHTYSICRWHGEMARFIAVNFPYSKLNQQMTLHEVPYRGLFYIEADGWYYRSLLSCIKKRHGYIGDGDYFCACHPLIGVPPAAKIEYDSRVWIGCDQKVTLFNAEKHW